MEDIYKTLLLLGSYHYTEVGWKDKTIILLTYIVKREVKYWLFNIKSGVFHLYSEKRTSLQAMHLSAKRLALGWTNDQRFW